MAACLMVIGRLLSTEIYILEVGSISLKTVKSCAQNKFSAVMQPHNTDSMNIFIYCEIDLINKCTSLAFSSRVIYTYIFIY